MILVTYTNLLKVIIRSAMYVCATEADALDALQPWLTGKDVTKQTVGDLLVFHVNENQEYYIIEPVEVK